MPRQKTEHERQEFLADLHVAVLSVASDDGRPPLAVPVWYSYRPGGTISFFTGTQGRKARKTRLIQKAGVLSLSVQREEFPYKYVTVEGTVSGPTGRRPPSVRFACTGGSPPSRSWPASSRMSGCWGPTCPAAARPRSPR